MKSSPQTPQPQIPRVRFAPSPTGQFHIGSARTALFNWLYARQHKGTFILRVEDTDTARNTPEALASLLAALRWLGLDWDEGPELGGALGPYFQSERANIYKEYLEKLKAADRAYERDGAVWLRLEGPRKKVYDPHRKAEVQQVQNLSYTINDCIRGKVTRPLQEDFILQRSNGQYGFHFVNVVDDITMNITHIIRGEDHLSNTTRHLALYEALGATPPTYAHLPLILKSSGQGKMSKRDTGALIENYQQRQLLPAAVCNFLALLGWSPKDDTEYLPLATLTERFRLEHIQKDAAKFDEQKLLHLNALHLRHLKPKTFEQLLKAELEKQKILEYAAAEQKRQKTLEHAAAPENFSQIAALAQPKAREMPQLAEQLAYFFTDAYRTDANALQKLKYKPENAAKLLDELSGVQNWSLASLQDALEKLVTATQQKKSAFMPLLRLACTGQSSGLALLETLELLGEDKTIKRLKNFIENHLSPPQNQN